MKILILTLIFAINCLRVCAQQSFFYNISVAPSDNGSLTYLYVSYEIAGIKYIDSLDLQRKPIKLSKTLPQPVPAIISTSSSEYKGIPVMLANNSLNVIVRNTSISVNKSKLQEDYLYLTENDRIRPTYFPLYSELSAKNDTVGLMKLGIVFDSLKNDDIKKSYEYFKANKTSLLSLFSLLRYTSFFADYSKVEKDFTILPDWAKMSPDGISILAKIEGAKSAQINTKAKDFSQESLTGQIIQLDQFNGKYIFLDFWASWCAPCRKEHPNLIRTYEQFKSKKFDIISISLDSERNRWQDAVIKDGLTWTQVSDLKGQQNNIAISYGVQSIPSNFLVDPNGIIIAKNLTSEELYNLLSKLFEK